MKSARGRRAFLHRSAALAAAGIVEQAAALPALGRSGTIADVRHIVILMQENRSFDHYFGSLNGVRGFADPFPLPLPGGRTVWAQPADPASPAAGPPVVLPWRLDTGNDFALMRVEGTPHTWPDAQQAWDHGRMANWTAAKRNHSMACFDRADLPWQAALADAFTLCDAYHCSFMGGTHPNRYYLNTGTIDPFGRGGGPALYNDFDDFGPAQGAASGAGYSWTTYAERLQAAGVDWHVYQDLADNFGDNSLAAFRRFRDAYHGRTTADRALVERAGTTGAIDRLAADVQAGRLPAVSWIVGTAEGSEHPWKSSPAQGAEYVARVLQALTSNPEVWGHTVLLINYDENDGYFDHVPPPAPPSVRRVEQGRFELAGASTVDTTGEYHLRLAPGRETEAEAQWLARPYGLGPRVPMFVVSPWSRGGWVCSEVFDHTSTLRFIEARFGVPEPNISPWRRAVCGDLRSALDFRRSDRQPPRVALAPVADRARLARELERTRRPTPPDEPRAPEQAQGPRPARALPYRLQAEASADKAGLRVRLRNTGNGAAVVHVMDLRRLHELPRRFTLGPAGELQDTWSADAEQGLALWLWGPNGWHRRLSGRIDATLPQVRLLERPTRSDLELRISNLGPGSRSFSLLARRYGLPAPATFSLAAGGHRRLRLPTGPDHRWYDWSLRMLDGPPFEWRWAGHLENGRPGLSDPAMHGPAVLTTDDTAWSSRGG